MASFIVTFTQIIALVRKELLALIKEPASRALLIAPAFLQALLYGYGATYDLTHVPYAVLDQSRSAASTELLARMMNNISAMVAQIRSNSALVASARAIITRRC